MLCRIEGWLLVAAALSGCTDAGRATVTVCSRGSRAALSDELAGGAMVLRYRGAGGQLLSTHRADVDRPTTLDSGIPDGARTLEIEGLDAGGMPVAEGQSAIDGDEICVCLARTSERALVCENVVCEPIGGACQFAPAAADEPCQRVEGAETVLDDGGPCFEAGGTPEFIRQEQGVGIDGSLRWTHTTDADAVDNLGRWELSFAAAGSYEIEAHTPAGFGESMRARYEIVHGADLTEVIIDQSAVDGWNPIGTIDFAAGGAQLIRLPDNTGEPGSAMVRLVFDAVRLRPVESP